MTATGPLLVHFFDFAQLNSVRALPYVIAWNQRYAEHGLSVLGIHSPRFPFTPAGLDDVLAELGVTHPVADDAQYSIWHDYGCEGWPSLFLWGQGGALRWFHFGEGEYRATEEAIAEELLAEDVTLQLPEPLAPVRASDVPGALVMPPSEELFPGGSVAKPWQPSPAVAHLDVDYEAGGAWAVADGEGELRWWLDGEEGPASSPVGPRALIPLVQESRHRRHSLRIEADPGVRIWALSFEAGAP